MPLKAKERAKARVKPARPMPRTRLKRLKNDGEDEESDCMESMDGEFGGKRAGRMPADANSSIRKPDRMDQSHVLRHARHDRS
jgi:hypothetical protein